MHGAKEPREGEDSSYENCADDSRRDSSDSISLLAIFYRFYPGITIGYLTLFIPTAIPNCFPLIASQFSVICFAQKLVIFINLPIIKHELPMLRIHRDNMSRSMRNENQEWKLPED